MYPIYIPSKGRPKSKLFAKLPHAFVVVEPNEAFEYQKNNPDGKFIILPENDQGVTYARQFILDHARFKQHEWFWMLDDDITAFYEVIEPKKTVKIDATEALEKAEEIITSVPNAAQGGLEGSQFACYSTEPFTTMSHCEGCNLINVKRTRSIDYRFELVMKEDIDFSMQILAAGFDNVRVKKICCSCPTVGSIKGGLKELYDDRNNDFIASEQILAHWGSEFCRVVTKKTGRVDVRVNWRKLAKLSKERMAQLTF